MQRILALFLLLCVGVLVLPGCSRSKDSADSDAATATATADGGDDSEKSREGDPCSLLELREVEAAIRPLAGPPYREGYNGPDAEGSRCVYETKDLRSLRLDVTWSDGAMIMKMLGMPTGAAEQAGLKGKLPLPDGVMVAGEWDEAKALSCCEINAMRGDQVVFINFMNTRLTEQQGIDLLNASLKRLDAPLKNIDGAAGIEAAEARANSAAGRPKPVPACQLVTLEDATALLGPVDVLPVSNEQQCQYRAKAKMALLDFSVAWTGGYLAFRSDSEIAGKVFKGLMGDLAKDPADVQHVDYPGPWEQADVIAVDFVAVRKDVRMRVDLRGSSLEQAKLIVTKAMNRVSWPP
jgi:hypothetical protein